MKRRNFFKLMGISPAALMFKPEKKSDIQEPIEDSTYIGETYIDRTRTRISDIIDPEVLSIVILKEHELLKFKPLKYSKKAITTREFKWMV